MTYDDFLGHIIEALETYEDFDFRVRTFDEAGLLSSNFGLVINGEQFEMLNTWAEDLYDEMR